MYRVLITEDESLIRNGLKVLISWEKYGFVVAALAENGYKALEMMETQHFSVVITDVRMPRVDGLELIRTMREKNISSEVIIISGYRNFEYARTAIEFGVHNYLLKPISKEALIDTLISIRRNLDQKNGLTEKKDIEILMQIKSLVALHYQEDISMLMIGEELHYNAAYLGRLFMKETDMTFRDYLNTVRTAQAAELLAEKGRMVSDIAMQVGYKDINYFCKVFKIIYGMSPSEYRKEL
jgi:two-component system response regulator YesN